MAFCSARRSITHTIASSQFGLALDSALSFAVFDLAPATSLSKDERETREFSLLPDTTKALSCDVIKSLKSSDMVASRWVALWEHRDFILGSVPFSGKWVNIVLPPNCLTKENSHCRRTGARVRSYSKTERERFKSAVFIYWKYCVVTNKYYPGGMYASGRGVKGSRVLQPYSTLQLHQAQHFHQFMANVFGTTCHDLGMEGDDGFCKRRNSLSNVLTN